jgi:hypothetical protein
MATANVGTAAGEVYEVMRWMMSGSLVAECKADEKPLRLPWSRLLNAYHRSVSDHGYSDLELTPPILLRVASIFATLAANASFFRVLRLPLFDSSNTHSWPPLLQR